MKTNTIDSLNKDFAESLPLPPPPPGGGGWGGGVVVYTGANFCGGFGFGGVWGGGGGDGCKVLDVGWGSFTVLVWKRGVAV
jgi:hypothetical protein